MKQHKCIFSHFWRLKSSKSVTQLIFQIWFFSPLIKNQSMIQRSFQINILRATSQMLYDLAHIYPSSLNSCNCFLLFWATAILNYMPSPKWILLSGFQNFEIVLLLGETLSNTFFFFSLENSISDLRLLLDSSSFLYLTTPYIQHSGTAPLATTVIAYFPIHKKEDVSSSLNIDF